MSIDYKQKRMQEDKAFLEDPARWPQEGFICMKSYGTAGVFRDMRFGYYHRDQPNKISVRDLLEDKVTSVELFGSIEALLEEWTVD